MLWKTVDKRSTKQSQVWLQNPDIVDAIEKLDLLEVNKMYK